MLGSIFKGKVHGLKDVDDEIESAPRVKELNILSSGMYNHKIMGTGSFNTGVNPKPLNLLGSQKRKGPVPSLLGHAKFKNKGIEKSLLGNVSNVKKMIVKPKLMNADMKTKSHVQMKMYGDVFKDKHSKDNLIGTIKNAFTGKADTPVGSLETYDKQSSSSQMNPKDYFFFEAGQKVEGSTVQQGPTVAQKVGSFLGKLVTPTQVSPEIQAARQQARLEGLKELEKLKLQEEYKRAYLSSVQGQQQSGLGSLQKGIGTLVGDMNQKTAMLGLGPKQGAGALMMARVPQYRQYGSIVQESVSRPGRRPIPYSAIVDETLGKGSLKREWEQSQPVPTLQAVSYQQPMMQPQMQQQTLYQPQGYMAAGTPPMPGMVRSPTTGRWIRGSPRGPYQKTVMRQQGYQQ